MTSQGEAWAVRNEVIGETQAAKQLVQKHEPIIRVASPPRWPTPGMGGGRRLMFARHPAQDILRTTSCVR